MNVQPAQGLFFPHNAAAAAAPANPAAAHGLLQRTAAALIALPDEIRSDLQSCQLDAQHPERSVIYTERLLRELTHPECTLAECATRSQQLAADIETLRNHLNALEELQEGNPHHADLVAAAKTCLETCLDRLVNEVHIHHASNTIRAGDTTLGSLFQAANGCWRDQQIRRNPVQPGNAPVGIRNLVPPGPEGWQHTETALQTALQSENLGGMLNNLADVTFHLAGVGYRGEPFAAWFATRSVLAARQLTPQTVGIHRALIEELRHAHRDNLEGWRQAFTARTTPPLSEPDYAYSVATSITRLIGGHRSESGALYRDAPILRGLKQFSRLPEPAAVQPQIPGDQNWDDVVTPPGSPR